MSGDDFLTIQQAARWLGVSEPALRRRLDRNLIPIYSNPADLRSRLIKAADLERYAVPELVTPAGVERGGGEVAMSG